MGFFRREPLHKRLAREGGLLGPDNESLRPSWDKVGVHGIARPRRWDAVVSVAAEGISGDELDFVALEDGTVIVEREEGEADLAPLADAVEAEISRPYHAQAVRKGEALWAVAARRIQLARFEAEGDEIQLSVHDGERTLAIDGVRQFGSIPQLEELGERAGYRSFVANAVRVDTGVWEVQISPL